MTHKGYRDDGLTPERKEEVIRALAEYGNVTDACRIVGISTTTYYRHRHKDPAFRRECARAKPKARPRLEAVAWKRAVEGTPETVIRKGEVVQVKVKPSDAILRMLLQAADPGKYGGAVAALREKIEKELRPKIEAEVRAELCRPPSDEERRALREEIDAMLSDFNRRMGGDG